MPKRPSLAERMRGVVTPDGPTDDASPAIVRRIPRAAPQKEKPIRKEDNSSGFHASTRAGKKKVTAPLDPAAHKQIKQLALDLDANVETLLLEAINDLFKKHGKPPIA